MACPVCTKLNEGGECSRCGADLAGLRTLQRRADRHLDRAEQLLKLGMLKEAGEQAQAAWRVKHSPQAAECMVTVCAAQRNSEKLEPWLMRLRTRPNLVQSYKR